MNFIYEKKHKTKYKKPGIRLKTKKRLLIKYIYNIIYTETEVKVVVARKYNVIIL